MMCLNRSVTTINARLQLLENDIYIYIIKGERDTALEAKAQLYSDNID